MLRIKLPYPDRSLNPNVRRVWQASLKPKKEAREAGYWAAWDAAGNPSGDPLAPLFFGFLKSKPLYLRIAIHPPDNRRRDWINVVRAIKNYEDGIFDFIGMNDSKIKDVQIKMRHSCPSGKVLYLLYQK